MKKTTYLLVLFFSASFAIAQSSCGTAATVLLGSTTTAPPFSGETGTLPISFCGIGNGNGGNQATATKGKWYIYRALQSQSVIVSTLLPQNNADTRLIVYSGDCNALTCVGANDDYNGTNSSQVTFNAVAGTTYIIAFDNRYSQNGFDFTVMAAPPPAPDRLSFTSTPVAGIVGGNDNCIVDMNGDYLDDIVSAVNNTTLVITYQNVNGTFSSTTYPLTNTVIQPTWSIAAGDYNGDGYNDLIYGSGSGICLLKSKGDGTGYITDRKPQSYLVQRTNFVDIDNDGKLDAFACDDNAPNRYYMNDGTNMNHIQGGIGDFPTGGNYASLWSDFDNDGKLDMVLAKCGQGGSGVGGNIDQLFKNNGNGTYTDIAVEANMAAPEQSWSCAVGDFNNDGWMDVIQGVNSTSDGRTNVMRNNGDGTFTSVRAGSGYDTDNNMGREYVAHDFDNDGFLDVLGAGNTIMFGDGNFHFTPNPNTYPLSTVDRPIGDLNNDGFLDIQNGGNILFNNGNTNKWLAVNLRGLQSNRNGIGARIEIYGSWGKQIRDVQSGTGFQNMSTLTAHFGIGQATTIERLVIRWPSGAVDTIENVSPNQKLLVVEGSTLGVNSFNNGVYSVYPNPARNVINIQLKDNLNVTLKSASVFDLTGKVVLTTDNVNQPINIEKLSSGTYILSVSDANNRNYTQKFIKE